jgi:hypothetical protein
MFPGGRRLADELGVGIGAGANDHRFDILIFQDSPVIFKGSRNLKISRTLFGSFQKNVRYSQDPGLRNPVSETLGMHPANPARANDSNIDFCSHL